MKTYFGFCPSCKELKDDDYGQWLSDSEGLPIMKDGEIMQARGCRDCGDTLISMEAMKEVIPVSQLTPAILKGILDDWHKNKRA